MKKELENAYLKIIHNIPDYGEGIQKRSKKKIQEIMSKYEYDDDCIENINYDFCQGFNVAKEIILKEIKEELDKMKQHESIQEDLEDICWDSDSRSLF